MINPILKIQPENINNVFTFSILVKKKTLKKQLHKIWTYNKHDSINVRYKITLDRLTFL